MSDVNQCDGCRSNMPVKDGIHRDENDRAYMCCTRNRYKTPENRISQCDVNPMLEITVADYRYGFSVQMLNERDKAWILSVLPEQMQKIHNRAVESTKRAFQKQLRELAGIPDDI